MDTPHLRHLICNELDGVLVLTITAPQVRSDELASELSADFTAALAQHEPSKVVLDLQHVQVISSRGFGSIAALHQAFVRAKGGKIALCGLNPMVRDELNVIRWIDSRGSSPAIAGSDEKPTGGKPRAKPLFEIVATNVQAAVNRLNGAVS
jgi:anti-anti-sigma factor